MFNRIVNGKEYNAPLILLCLAYHRLQQICLHILNFEIHMHSLVLSNQIFQNRVKLKRKIPAHPPPLLSALYVAWKKASAHTKAEGIQTPVRKILSGRIHVWEQMGKDESR